MKIVIHIPSDHKNEFNDKMKHVYESQRNYKFKNNVNISFINNFEGELYKETRPNWSKNRLYIKNNISDSHDVTYYYISVTYIGDDLCFIEICGDIKIWNKTIAEYDCIITIDNADKAVVSTPADLKKIIDIKIIKSLSPEQLTPNMPLSLHDLNLLNTIIKNDDYTHQNMLNYYNDLIANKNVSNECKLNDYIKDQCLDKNNNSSETIYNSNICSNNTSRYTLIDRTQGQTKGCEIADIYDIIMKRLIHNGKTNKLPYLALQIKLSALSLNSGDYNDFCDKYNIDVANYTYVFGIIMNGNISHRDKLAIGETCYSLDQLKIPYLIDLIKYIE